MKKEAEEKVGMVFQMYNAIEYQTQVVAGTNFKILVSSSLMFLFTMQLCKTLQV